MSILRNAFDQNIVDQEQANFLQEQADAQGMGAIRRSWNAGRVGGDLNAARIDEAAALAADDAQKAALLGQQREHLERRQALYAPGVGRVEDIRGLGDALSWAGTQMGQGAASMADPVALSAAGAALGKLPGPFKLAPLAAGIGAFALNQRQMAGEHVGRLREDPTAMANLGAKGVYDQANLVGAAGGALETLFPFAVGRAFGGAALRQGAGGLMGRSFGAKTLGGMAMEGGTEVAQGEIGRFAHTDANALRKTEGDWSDRLNEFVGSFTGSGPMSAAGAAADMAYGGTARAGEVVKEKAGEVVDMAADAAEKAKQAYKDSGLKGAVDLGVEGTKSVFEKTKEYVSDQVNHDAAVKRAVADVERYTMTPQEFALLTESPPPDLPPDQQRAWTDEMFGKRQTHLFKKMLSLEEQGVPEATQFVDRMTSDDPLEVTKAVYDATDFLFERHAAAATQQHSAVLKAMSGGFIQQAAKKMTRGAKVVGDAAAFAGLNVAEGVRQGLGKKNKQGVAEEGDHSSPRQLDYETWKRMREAGGVGAGQGELFGRPSAARVEFTADEQKHAIARANKLFERGDEKPIKTDPVAAARSLERATLFAEIMAAEARARKQRVVAHRVEQDGDGDVIGIENFARYVAYEIADMAESWGGRARQSARPTGKDGGQAKVAVSLLDSMADDIVGLVGSAAGSDVVSRMAQQGAPESQPFFELLQERVTNWRGNAAERAARERTARDQMVALLPQQFQADLLADDGIGARKMYETIGAIARGLITPQKREEIEQYIPRETLNQMLTLYGATVPDRGGSAESDWLAGDDSEAFDPDRLSMNDDGDVVEGASDFEKNMGEKALSRGGVGQKRYGHPNAPSMRESPFAPAKRMSKEEYIAFRELERERRMAGEPADVYPEVERPQLFTKGQKYSDGRDAIEARIEAMSEKLGPDFSVTARSAQDVMDAGNMHAASRLAIFRDYMFAASRDTSLPVEAQLVAKNRAHMARKALLDALDDPSALEGLRRNKVGNANMTEEQKRSSGFEVPGVVEQWVEELLKDYEKAGGVRQNKKVGDTPPPRLTPDERKMLYAGMENYFRSRYVVEAERQIDRESSRIDAVEIRKMIEKGRGTYDVLKRDYGDGTDEMKAAMADSNLLWFKSTLHDERTGKPGEVPISANTLVGWVRKQRSLSEEYSGNDERLSNRDKNDAFLSDLYEGISILMNSGFMTDDLPHLKGPDGKPQTFEDVVITAKNKKPGVTGRIPANLQLETTTGSGYMFARDERVREVPKKRHERTKEEDSDDARDDGRYQKARDWELARGDDLDDGGGNEATQIEVGEGERETLNPYEDIKRKALKASSAAYEKRLGVEQQMRELGLALQKAQEKGSAVQIAALARRINELAVVADGLPTEPPDTIEEIESRIEATRAELVAAMAVGGGDAKRIAKLGEEAAAKKRWVAPLELRGQATAASVMKQRVASLEDQRREERAPGEKISTLKRRLFELTALLDTELDKEHEKAPPDTPGAPKRARVKSLAGKMLDAGDRDGIGAAYTRGGRAAAMREKERQSAAPRTETPEERMAREAGLLGWLDDTGARENETPAQRRARLQKARESALLGEASEQGGKRAHSVELERQDTQRAAGLRNNRIDRWRVDRDVEEHVLAAAKRAADDEGLMFGSTEYREFVRNYTERRATERSRDSEQVTAEKVDLSMRSKMVGAGIGPEPKHSARKLAEDRAGAILETFRRHGVDKGMEVLESRLRTAKATNTDGGAGTVGGAHYAWPLAHILSKRQIEGMDLVATDPQDLKILRRLLAMRSELAKVIHDSASLRLADKVDMVKAMASAEGAERVTAATVMKMLAGAAQPARDAEAVAQSAAREQAAKIAAKKAARGVAATEAPKSQPPQGGVQGGKAGFVLTGKTIHTPKDQAKASRANVFIGRGVEGSSTALYAAAAERQGIPVNPGKYSASDKVFVSANGNRSDRVRPDFDEIGKAVQAGATIITDDKENRARGFNVGEREVAEFLTKQGYEERAPGEWGPKGALYPSRSLSRQENRAAVKASPDKAVFLKAADDVQRTVRSLYALGIPQGDVLHHKLVMKQMQPIMQGILKGDPAASVLRDSLLSDIDMTYALPFDAALAENLRAQLKAKAPTTLGDMMAAFESSSTPDHFKAIAKAVRKVAGRTPTLAPRDGDMSDDYGGAFDPTSGLVFVRPDSHTVASTVLHEGVHAATVRAMSRDVALRQAVSDLLDHVVEHNPRLLGAYGTTNTLEFLAEGLSNRGLQRALYKIPASPKVAKYLGETLANAWDSFVALVRQAMNLDPKHTSALTQLLELSGRAMKSVGLDGAVADGMSQEERVGVLKRIQASPEKLRQAYREVLESPAWEEGVTKDARKALLKEMTMPDGATTMSHTGGYVLAEIRGMMRAATPGSMSAKTLRAATEREISQLFSSDGGAGLIPSRRKLNAQGTAARDTAPVRQLNKRLVGLLAERGIKIEERALEHVPPEMRVSLVNRTMMADLKEPLAEDVAKFLSWMTLGSDMYQRIADGIAGTAFEKTLTAEVNRDARQSMYTPTRKQREVVRRAVERLLTNGLLKKHAAEAPLPLRVVQMVRSAIKGIMESLGGVKYKDLQGLADQYVNDLLSGKITLERPRTPGSERVKPYEVFGADQHAADLTFALTDGGGFALTGSLAYASRGTVYRPAGMAIHDLDFTTALTQRAAEQRLERLYPQAHKVRSFGGLGDFVSTYVVPPKGHKVDLVAVKGGVVQAFVVRDAGGKIVGRYTNNDMGESSSGVKGTVVDLISDKRGAAGKLTIPTSFGDKQVPIADVAHAMAQKLMYARDKDITDFANFVPNSGRKLNAQSTQIHNDLQRPGFAATHDSPIRHEGKFNWREHTGKGEGNAAFGAGTYLSTAEGVHRFYKKQFTAEIARGKPKPTWLGHFVKDPNGADPGMDQVEGIILEIENVPGVSQEIADAIRRLFDACIPIVESVVGGRTRLEYADPSLMKPFPKGVVDEIGKLHKGAARWMGEFNINLAASQTPKNPGAKSPTYQVSVNIKPEELLDWDAPLNEQSGLVRKALGGLREAKSLVVRDIATGAVVEERQKTGDDIYRALTDRLGSQAAASDYLQSLGILGHKYAASGGKNDTHPNYVIYDDSKITTNYVHFNKQGTAKAGQEKLIDEYINSPAGADMAFEVNDEYSRAEVREMFESGALADTALGKKWAALNSAPRDTTPTDEELLSGGVEPQGRVGAKPLNKARAARQKLDELFAAAAEDFGIDISEVEGALTDGEHQNSWAAEVYRNIVNGLDELEVIAVFEPDAKSREKLLKALDDDGSERSLTDVEDIEYRDVAAEDAGLLGAEPPDGGQKPPEDAQEPPKSAPRALAVVREGQGTKKARKRAQRTVPTDEDIQAAKDYLRRVLGDQIRTRFGEITGYSGQWIEDENVIEVSTLTLAGALNVARHEALHAFWSKFVRANPQAIKVLSSLTNDPRILRRLETLLADDPHALEQLADGEERLAYIYQFAMAGQLKLPHTPGTTLMSKIRKFLRQVFLMVRDDERAVDLLYAFEAGQMSKPDAAAKAIAKAINQGTWARKAARGMDGVVQGAAALVLPASTILATSSSRTAREVGKMLFTNPGEEGSAENGTGYLNARNQKMRAYNNLFRAAIEDLDDRQLKELTEVMQRETPLEDINDPDVAQAKEKLHRMFARFHKYLTEERGLRMGEIRGNYFPVVYDPDKVRAGLRDMLTSPKYIGEMNKMVDAINKNIAKGNAFLERQGALEESRDPVTLEGVLDGIVNHITRDNPTDDIEMEPKRHDGVLRPWFAGGERRVLFFLDPADRAKFQEKDIILTATRYLRQGVRAAEYSSRFGRDGRLLAQKVMVGGEMTEIGMLPNIKGELYEESHDMLKRGELKDEKARKKWVDRQYRDVARAIGAMEGSLGHDVSELVRNVNAASIVYQNIRLLPLALFSSFVDPLGIIAGGGTMSQAWDTFGRGIRGVIRQWGDMVREQPPERAKDEWEKLAELAGVVDSATFSHLLTDEYGSVYLGSKASKANELMFKANGMEAWNRGMRVGATKAAVAFMERHNKGGDKHSERWLRDLGFEVGGLKLDSDGRMITGKRDLMAANPGMSLDEAEAYIDKVHAAINRWVESTILSPNAAQRPAWGSDPHYGMFWHLKQFAYSFHQTIMKRAINEAGHGNYAPLGVFAWYIPAMIVSDVVKGLALGAGELPAHMKGYDMGDWMLHGLRRAGILGIGDIAIEGAKDPTGLAGPSVEQATDLFFKPLEENLVRALPANALYSRAIL